VSPFRQPPPQETPAPISEGFERAFYRAQTRRRVLKGLAIAVGLLVVASPFAYCALNVREQVKASHANDLDDKENADLLRLVGEEERAVAEREAAWPKAVTREALAKLTIGSRPCDVALRPPSATTIDQYVKGESFFAQRASLFGDIVVAADGVVGKSHALESKRERLGYARSQANDRRATKQTLADTREAAQRAFRDEYDVIVLVKESIDPKISFEPAASPVQSFTPGRVTGRAFVYDHQRKAVACACDFEAESSPKLDFKYFTAQWGGTGVERDLAARAALKRDLEVQTRLEIIARARAVE
jgi:hypothetical protein